MALQTCFQPASPQLPIPHPYKSWRLRAGLEVEESLTRKQCRLSTEMKTWTPAATVKQTTCLCRDTGGKGTLPTQHTTFNTLDNWAIKPPPNQKGKGPERKVYRVMARNMYTIHSVTLITCSKIRRRKYKQPNPYRILVTDLFTTWFLVSWFLQ